jgi:glycosyltransferase involved in cell wall biosynthesis
MNVALVSSVAPLVRGGGRFIVEWLTLKLLEAGHHVETVWIPCTGDGEALSTGSLLTEMTAFRLLDLGHACDRVITFRPPAHLTRHSHKTVWFIHHFRGFYDLWDSPYRPVPDTPYWRAFRRSIRAADNIGLHEARRVFSNSKVVADRLRRFNAVESEVLYPPVIAPERFFVETWGDEIVCISRIERHKRQHLLIEAMRHVQTPVRLRVVGRASDPHYIRKLESIVSLHKLEERVTIDHRWISEDEKASLLATALAAAYVPFDEDSYGYPTIEAAHASKATVAALDGGGVAEFVEHDRNGILVPPEAAAIAEAFDRLWWNRNLAMRLGRAANRRIAEMNIGWDHVIARLMS